mmetsp:Transcript_63997/g.187777  ORF Transcript_63997/g.187777 Transcript_63997/m.187777 type:complete len:592 (-) Transcript_63997:1857-3632(-)
MAPLARSRAIPDGTAAAARGRRGGAASRATRGRLRLATLRPSFPRSGCDRSAKERRRALCCWLVHLGVTRGVLRFRIALPGHGGDGSAHVLAEVRQLRVPLQAEQDHVRVTWPSALGHKIFCNAADHVPRQSEHAHEVPQILRIAAPLQEARNALGAALAPQVQEEDHAVGRVWQPLPGPEPTPLGLASQRMGREAGRELGERGGVRDPLREGGPVAARAPRAQVLAASPRLRLCPATRSRAPRRKGLCARGRRRGRLGACCGPPAGGPPRRGCLRAGRRASRPGRPARLLPPLRGSLGSLGASVAPLRPGGRRCDRAQVQALENPVRRGRRPENVAVLLVRLGPPLRRARRRACRRGRAQHSSVAHHLLPPLAEVVAAVVLQAALHGLRTEIPRSKLLLLGEHLRVREHVHRVAAVLLAQDPLDVGDHHLASAGLVGEVKEGLRLERGVELVHEAVVAVVLHELAVEHLLAHSDLLGLAEAVDAGLDKAEPTARKLRTLAEELREVVGHGGALRKHRRLPLVFLCTGWVPGYLPPRQLGDHPALALQHAEDLPHGAALKWQPSPRCSHAGLLHCEALTVKGVLRSPNDLE